MPLVRLSAETAVSTRKSNVYAGWGDRTSANRVEPITTPSFRVPFRIEPKSKIFTVGSCFARNVEDELKRRGFQLPMLDAAIDDPATLNNYGTPSIYNEFAWALGEQTYDPGENILEVMPGKYGDLHLHPNRRLQPYEKVLANRKAIHDAYRRVTECPVIIMTLGLVEIWFDSKTGYYLNAGPRPSQIKAEPARFEMHVLSFHECYDYLDRTVRLLLKHCHPDLKMLLTISPVPLQQTHRDEDVIVANMYSKSVLRAVAETLVANYPFVTYFPSYESVVLSDRKRAWTDDMIHVSKEIVAINVNRMVDAFIGGDEDPDDWSSLVEGAASNVVVQKAKDIRARSRQLAISFFNKFGALSKRNGEFAMEHALHLADLEDFEGVLAVLAEAPAGAMELHTLALRAETLVRLGRAGEAISLLDSYLQAQAGQRKKIKARRFWASFMKTAMATGDESAVISTCYKVISANVKHDWWAYSRTGMWFLQQAKFEKAIHYMEMAINTGEEAIDVNYFLAEAFAAIGQTDKARAALAKLRSDGKSPTSREERLKTLLAPIE